VPETLDVRVERPEDAAAASEVQRRAFGAEGPVIVDLIESLRGLLAARGGLSLVATLSGEVAGHVMFTRSLLDAPARLVDVLVLSPLAVAPEHQRHGVGAALVRRGLELLAETQEPLVFLEGSPTYYRRFGFVHGGELGFRKPSLRIPDEAFQVFCLPAYEPWMTGTLVYAEAFWRHDSVGLRE
jgi:putative acetyltransferase